MIVSVHEVSTKKQTKIRVAIQDWYAYLSKMPCSSHNYSQYCKNNKIRTSCIKQVQKLNQSNNKYVTPPSLLLKKWHN